MIQAHEAKKKYLIYTFIHYFCMLDHFRASEKIFTRTKQSSLGKRDNKSTSKAFRIGSRTIRMKLVRNVARQHSA
jgi:hypothetical protein